MSGGRCSLFDVHIYVADLLTRWAFVADSGDSHDRGSNAFYAVALIPRARRLEVTSVVTVSERSAVTGGARFDADAGNYVGTCIIRCHWVPRYVFDLGVITSTTRPSSLITGSQQRSCCQKPGNGHSQPDEYHPAGQRSSYLETPTHALSP